MESKSKSALLTIEAALVLPIFMLALYFFLYFYQVLMIQENLHSSATKIVRDISSYGPIFNLLMKYEGEETSTVLQEAVSSQDSYLSQALSEIDLSTIVGMLIDDLYLQQRLYSELGDSDVVNRCVVDGFDGISLLGSSIFDEEECVTLTMTYQIRLPLFDSFMPSFPVIQTVRMRSFNGYSVASKVVYDKQPEDDRKEDMVYIVENPTVYHTNGSCTYIRLSTKSIESYLLPSARNKHGGKYQECEICFHNKDQVPSTVYITEQGNCYHKNTACSALKRTVSSVPLSQVSHLRECKRCQNYKSN